MKYLLPFIVFLGVLIATGGQYSLGQDLNKFGQRLSSHEAEQMDEASRLFENGLKLLDGEKHFEARKSLAQSLKISDAILRPNSESIGIYSHVLGMACEKEGSTKDAVFYYERAIKVFEAVHGTDSRESMRALSDLAKLLKSEGEFTKAAPLFEKILANEEKRLGPNNLGLASKLYELALLRKYQTRYTEALTLHKRALKIRELHLGPESSPTAQSLFALGQLYMELGDYSQAEKCMERAVKIAEIEHGPEHLITATGFGGLADLHSRQGRLDKAISLYQKQLKITSKLQGSEHPDTAQAMQNLAFCYKEQRNYDEAIPLYQKSLKLMQQHVGMDDFGTASVESNLAWSYAAVGRHKESTELFGRSLNKRLNHVVEMVPTLSHEYQQRFLSKEYYFQSEIALSFAVQHGPSIEQTAEESASWVANGKGLAQSVFANRTRSHPIGERAEVSEHQLDWIPFDDLKGAISKDEVLVDIARVRQFNFARKQGEAKVEPSSYVAWITFPDERKVEVINLGLAKEIDELVREVREQIQKTNGILRESSEIEAQAQLQAPMLALSSKLWTPIAAKLNGINSIVLCPDDILWLVPWSALPVDSTDPKKPAQFLVEQYELRFSTNGRDFVAKGDPRKTNRPVIFANPSFDQQATEKQDSILQVFKKVPGVAEPSLRSIAGNGLLPNVQKLPGTAAEATAVKPRMKAYTSQEPILYLERWALEHAVKKLVSPKVAAFSTHGFFFGKGQDKNKALSGNPLLRCGLLFAGCNNHTSVVGDDDGILTGLEITGIDFRGTELVVLSACETGVGEVNSDGVAGLRQAFQLAGAESVLASLWSIDDVETARLMNLFFDNLAKGMTKSESLRQAQLARIKARRARHGAAHPFFWAAFTLTGQD